MAEGSVRGFVVATVCQTIEDFVERYHSRIGDTWIFVSVIEERVIGRECAFAILLANRQPVLAGICEVTEVYRDTHNQYQRSGMRLRIRRLGVESEAVFAELARRASAGRATARLARGSNAPLPEADASHVALLDVDYDAIPVDLDEEHTVPVMQR